MHAEEGSLPDPDTRVVLLLVGLIGAVGVSNLRSEVVDVPITYKPTSNR